MQLKKPFTKSEKRALIECLGKEKAEKVENDFNLLRLYGGIDSLALEEVLKEKLHKLLKAQKKQEKEEHLKEFRDKIQEYIEIARNKVIKTSV